MTQLLPSPGVTWHLNFSGSSIHSPSGCVPPLCVSHFISIPPSSFQNPGPSWCQAALPALVGEGAGDLTLLQGYCSRRWAGGHSSLGPCTHPRDLTVPAQSPHCFSMSSTIFCLQTSYKLGFHWLFTVFLRRLARYSSWAQENLALLPPTLLPSFPLPTPH